MTELPSPQLPKSLSDLRFALVGPGRVGESLAAWAVARGAVLEAVGGRAESAAGRVAAERLGAPFVELDGVSGTFSSAPWELLLVAVSDPALEAVAELLARSPQAAVALHVSGSRPAGALGALRRAGSAIGSLHPLRAFPQPCVEAETAAEIVFGVDGDPAALALAHRLVAAWGARAVEIAEADRPLYHLAATLAAGGVATLLSAAAEIGEHLGLPETVLGGYLSLARSALDEVERAGSPPEAITGPVARGDGETVARQLEAVAEVAPELARSCLAVALETCRQLRRGGRESSGWSAFERRLEGLWSDVRFLDHP